MKPFLLLSIRPEYDAATAEAASVARFAGLAGDELVQIRVETGPLPALDLDDYAGIFLGGGPFNASDAVKSPLQQRVESDLNRVIADVVERDFPFLGLCYGIGTLTAGLGGIVDRTYGEQVGAAAITITDEGLRDPLFAGISSPLWSFVGHKEACLRLPESATLLATGTACPVQAFRVGTRVYATQFHPELDIESLVDRMRIYHDAGYFPPEETDALIAAARASHVSTDVHKILTNFVAIARA